MRFFCELGDEEHLVDADTPEDAARLVARQQAERTGVGSLTLTVNVAEANEADLPLIAGDDYTVTVEASSSQDGR